MVKQEQHQRPTEAPCGGAQGIPLFSSWVYLWGNGSRHLDGGLEPFPPALTQDQPNVSLRTSCGSWYCASDLVKPEEPDVATIRRELGPLWAEVEPAPLDLATILPAPDEYAPDSPHLEPAPVLATAVPARRRDLVIGPLGDRGRYVVKDPCTGAFFTFGEQEHFLLRQLDGAKRPAAVCRAFAERFGEPLSEAELDGFVALARRQGLLQPASPSSPVVDGTSTTPPAVGEPAPPIARPRQSLLYWRKSLFDPDRLFTWLAPKVGFVWTRGFLLVSAACILFAAVLVWTGREALASSFAYAWRWETIVLAWLTLLVATTLHECAHGLTCKHHGGEVREVGFLMMFFLPCFYCNVSDAWLFKEKSKRLWVTLAGGYCDLFLWALAVFVWRLAAPESLVNYLAWVVLSVLGARVFFNFNPLLKLDGYYLLSDWLEVPNLRQRAWERVHGWARWLLWGAARPGRTPRGRFLFAYGLTSWLFSLFFLVLMLVGFFQYLGTHWGLAGGGLVVLLGAATLPGMFQGFIGGEVRKMIQTRRKRATAWALGLGTGTVLVALTLVFVQIEDQASGPFEVRPTARAEIRAPVAGFLREVALDEGERAYSGCLVARLEVPDLDSQLAQKQAAVREAEARLHLLEEGPRPEMVEEQRLRLKRARDWRDLAQQDLKRGRRVLREELAAFEEQIAQYSAEQTFAQEVMGRSRKLVDGKIISTEEYREAEKKLQVARAKQQQTQSEKRAREETGTQAAEEELARRELELAAAEADLRLLEVGPRPKEVEAEQAKLARLQEEARYLESLQGKLLVSSPIGGVVTTPRLREMIGRYLKEGDLICAVEDVDELEAEVGLAEADAARVRPGQAVELKARALPFETFRATVDRNAPRAARAEAGPSALQPVRGELPSTGTVYCRLQGSGLQPGMTGRARISCGPRPLGELLADRILRLVRMEFWG